MRAFRKVPVLNLQQSIFYLHREAIYFAHYELTLSVKLIKALSPIGPLTTVLYSTTEVTADLSLLLHDNL